MLEIGTIQNLTVVKKVDFGVYLAERFGLKAHHIADAVRRAIARK